MADIFEEVEEGLRQDRMTLLWKQYGIFAYLAGALIIGGVGLYEYLQYRGTQTLETHATSLESGLAALVDQEYESAATQFSELISENVAVSPVAAHFLADVKLDGNGDAMAASEALLASVGEVTDDPTAALALIKAAYLQADTSSLEETQSLLAPLLDADTPFAALAKELVAAKLFEAGDTDGARRAYNDLRFSDNVPPGVMTRATRALASLPAISEPEASLDDEAMNTSDQADAVLDAADDTTLESEEPVE